MSPSSSSQTAHNGENNSDSNTRVNPENPSEIQGTVPGTFETSEQSEQAPPQTPGTGAANRDFNENVNREEPPSMSGFSEIMRGFFADNGETLNQRYQEFTEAQQALSAEEREEQLRRNIARNIPFYRLLGQIGRAQSRTESSSESRDSGGGENTGGNSEALHNSETVNSPVSSSSSVPAESSAGVSRSLSGQNSEGSGSTEDTTPPASTDSNPNRLSGFHESAHLFDELLDQAMESMAGEPRDQAFFPPNSRENESSSENDPNSESGTGLGVPGNVSNVDGATVFTTGAPASSGTNTPSPGTPGAADNSSAIVITVNYMFMDGVSDASAGRTGSLVVTIPNNTNNREPQVISQFISLATRMAYNALLHNGPKPKPGITVEKFNSFKSLDVEELVDTQCSICFEQFDTLPCTVVDDLLTHKRRKLSPNSYVPSGSATPDPISAESNEIEHEQPPSTAGGSGENTPPVENTSESGREEAEDAPPQKPYLCDDDEEFDHVPMQLPCKHVFGKSCIAHWLKESTSCPLCRLSVADSEQAPRRENMPPHISFVRFGGLDGAFGGNSREGEASRNESTEEGGVAGSAGAPEGSHPGNSSGENSQHGDRQEEGSLPRFLRRMTSAFTPSPARRHGQAPPPPLEASGRRSSERNRHPPFSPVIHNIQNFLRRGTRSHSHSHDHSGSNSFFASGVASRRTANGVETVTSDSNASIDVFEPSRGDMRDINSLVRAYSENGFGETSRDETRNLHREQGEEEEASGDDSESHPTGRDARL